MSRKHGPVGISERGRELEIANNRQRCSNLNYGKTIIIHGKENKEIKVTVGQKCPVCYKRVRGLNHDSGAHHNRS